MKPAEPVKKSRWDVSAQGAEQQQQQLGGTDPLSELLTAARQQADHQGETGSTPALPTPGGTSTSEVCSRSPLASGEKFYSVTQLCEKLSLDSARLPHCP